MPAADFKLTRQYREKRDLSFQNPFFLVATGHPFLPFTFFSPLPSHLCPVPLCSPLPFVFVFSSRRFAASLHHIHTFISALVCARFSDIMPRPRPRTVILPSIMQVLQEGQYQNHYTEGVSNVIKWADVDPIRLSPPTELVTRPKTPLSDLMVRTVFSSFVL